MKSRKMPNWAKVICGAIILIVAVAAVFVAVWGICAAVNNITMLEQWHMWFPAREAVEAVGLKLLHFRG